MNKPDPSIRASPNGKMSDFLYANLYPALNQKHQDPIEKAHDELVPWLLWRIWRNRNEHLFRGKDYSAPNTVNKAMDDMEEWLGRKEEVQIEVPHHHSG